MGVGDRQTGAYLHRFAWTGIVRHQVVKHRSSPDDPAFGDCWARRRRTAPLPISNTALRRLGAQHGRCHICKATLYADSHPPELPHQWERWLAANRTAIITITTRDATTDEARHRLIHADCLNHSGNHTPTRPTANRTCSSRMR